MKISSIRQFFSNALKKIPIRYRTLVYKLIRTIIPGRRSILAAKYLKGSGLEIGAMHNPLRLSRGVSVQYVDYFSREENLERFSEIGHLNLVNPHFVEDGFTLPSFKSSSMDFLIANHVLEHSNNLYKTLNRWAEVLRPHGTLFFSVPVVDLCFDRGRRPTAIEHFVLDFELESAGNLDVFREETKNHYIEWLSISLPAMLTEQGLDYDRKNKIEELLKKTADELLAENDDIHFHTFTPTSFKGLLDYFCSNIRRDFKVLEIAQNNGEIIGILKRVAN